MDLLEVLGREYRRANAWSTADFSLKILLFVLSFFAIFNSSTFSMVIGFCTLLIPIGAFLVRERSSHHYVRAENMRRLLLLIDGLGIEAPALEIAQLKIDGGNFSKSKPLYRAPYYNSQLPPGPRRLTDIMAESAFFTKNLAYSSFKFFGAITIFGISSVFLYMYFLIETNVLDTKIAPKVITALLVFFVTGNLASLSLSFLNLSKLSEKVLSQCDRLRKDENIQTTDIVKLYSDYNCALIKSHAIPGFIYKGNKDNLNEAWRGYK